MVDTTTQPAGERVIVNYTRHITLDIAAGQTIGEALDAYVEANDSPNYVVPDGKKVRAKIIIVNAVETDA